MTEHHTTPTTIEPDTGDTADTGAALDTADTGAALDTAQPLGPSHPVVARLIELQGDQSDAAFARRWLTCSAASWSRAKSGTYHAADHTRLAEKLEGSLAALEDHIAAGGPGGAVQEIVPLRFVRQTLAGVKRAFSEPRDRLVVALAPTGGGKTTVARAIAETYHGRVIVAEATEPWRTSYVAACHGVMSAAGVRDLPQAKRSAEAALLDELTNRPRILVIDEAHYFGPATINLVKAILNRTYCTVVMLAIPPLWERMKRGAWEESQQLMSRTCALVRSDAVPADDVATYLEARLNGRWSDLAGDERRDTCARIATVAKQFGQMATVARIAREMETEPRLGRDAAQAAIATVQTLRR